MDLRPFHSPPRLWTVTVGYLPAPPKSDGPVRSLPHSALLLCCSCCFRVGVRLRLRCGCHCCCCCPPAFALLPCLAFQPASSLPDCLAGPCLESPSMLTSTLCPVPSFDLQWIFPAQRVFSASRPRPSAIRLLRTVQNGSAVVSLDPAHAPPWGTFALHPSGSHYPPRLRLPDPIRIPPSPVDIVRPTSTVPLRPATHHRIPPVKPSL